MTKRKVAIITGGSRGIGAGLVAGYRARDWAVVATARAIAPSPDPQVLAVAGDVAEQETAGRVIDAALTWSTASCSWSFRPMSPARSCTLTAARSPVTNYGLSVITKSLAPVSG